jgi:hypothetical protein
VANGLIVVRGKVYVRASSPSMSRILESAHDVGHEGAEKTLHRLRANFHLSGARAGVGLCQVVCRLSAEQDGAITLGRVALASEPAICYLGRRCHGFH